MNREVTDSLQDIDCVLMLADARGWRVLKMMQSFL